MSGDIGLQVQHRLLAYLLLFAAVVLVGLTRGRGRVGRGAIVTLCVVLVQVLLGISNVLFHIPVEVSVLHSAGAAAIVLCATWLNYEAWRSPLRLLAGESTEVRPLGEVVGV